MPQFKTLMPIRTKGSGAPLFCVHGQPLRMAQQMSKGRPIYGLSHVYNSDFNDETPESIEELAATYLSEMRLVQPVGPYYMCGFSAGALIAFEIARQLLAVGERIGNLTLVEPTFYDLSVVGESKLTILKERSDSYISFLIDLLKLLPKSLRARSYNFGRGLVVKAYFILGRPLPENLRWLGYLKSLGPAMRRYSYKPIKCGAVLLYGDMSEETRGQWHALWNDLLTKGAQVEVFPDVKNHKEFMVEPALGRTVALIERMGD